MSPAERQELASLLADLDEASPELANPFRTDPQLRRERRLALVLFTGCCIFLAGWIEVLHATLPLHFDAHDWRAVWVYFDVLLLAAFAATAWAIWRERQVLILLLTVVGTMLCCDAWFDVGTSLSTNGLWLSLLSAVFAELPLAVLAFAGARQLLRATVAAAVEARALVPVDAGIPAAQQAPRGCRDRVGAGHSLRRTRLAGAGIDEALPRSRAQRWAGQPG